LGELASVRQIWEVPQAMTRRQSTNNHSDRAISTQLKERKQRIFLHAAKEASRGRGRTYCPHGRKSETQEISAGEGGADQIVKIKSLKGEREGASGRDCRCRSRKDSSEKYGHRSDWVLLSHPETFGRRRSCRAEFQSSNQNEWEGVALETIKEGRHAQKGPRGKGGVGGLRKVVF